MRKINSPAPKIINHNGSGLAKITEGQTLLVSVELPYEADAVGGGFPVEIKPSDGLRLIERQQLYFYPAGDGCNLPLRAARRCRRRERVADASGGRLKGRGR